jgi:glycosyltransferase involved in cell wall biosynthesis
MRAGIDVSPLSLTRAGTARYLGELLPRLHRHPEVELVQLGFGGRGRVTAAVRDAVWYPLGLPRRTRRERLDLLHCPTFRAPPASRVPLVVTVFDLAVLRFPGAFNRWTRTYSRLAVPRAVRAASAVIAISEFTKRELVDLLDLPADRIRVIPLAAGEAFAPGDAAEDGEYVLAVGTLEPRKNLARLADAARKAGLELRVVGARGWGGVEADGAGVRWLGRVSDPALASLYRGALCVAYPSLYEGFGLPVLEAMACGAAVVTSRGSATEEIGAGAAVLVDPGDPGSIAAGLEEAISRREELGRLGLERARSYSWDRVAEQTLAVYREVA